MCSSAQVWHDIALCIGIDLEQSIAALASKVSTVRSLKLDSLRLEVHHFKLLGNALNNLNSLMPTIGTNTEEDQGPEINLFDFEEAETEAPVTDRPQEVPSAPSAPSAPAAPVAVESLAILRCPGPCSDAWSPLWQGLPQTLQELNIAENGLNDHAVAALCGALRSRCIDLVSLNLHGNRCKDVQRLADLVSRGQVGMLDLSQNTLNDREAVGCLQIKIMKCVLIEQSTCKRLQTHAKTIVFQILK